MCSSRKLVIPHPLPIPPVVSRGAATRVTMATRATRGATTSATSAATTPLERELEQAKAGTHPRIVAEEKRLTQQKTGLQGKADQLRKYRLSIVEAQFESERRAAEEVFAREKGIVQNRLIEECIDRQKRHSKVRPPPAPRERSAAPCWLHPSAHARGRWTSRSRAR